MVGDLGGAETYAELGIRVRDTGLVIQLTREVRNNRVTRPLREQPQRQEHSQSVPVSLSAEEVDVVAVGLALHLEPDRLLDLAELELHGRVVRVAIRVVVR